jgi:hypothetical protein
VGIGILPHDAHTDEVAGSLPFETFANGETHIREFDPCPILERRGR